MGDVDTLAEAADHILQARSRLATLDDDFLLYLVDMTLMQLGKAIALTIGNAELGESSGQTH